MNAAAVDCLLSLGSNRGDRARVLRRVLAALARLPRTRLLRASPLYASSPVGARGQREYLNCCAWTRTRLSPMGLLLELKRLEAAAGRRPAARWAPRPLDIDLLFYGDRRLRRRLLVVPHPLALRRRFVLEPLCALRPGWVPPARPRRSLREWLRRLNAPSQNVRIWSQFPTRHAA